MNAGNKEIHVIVENLIVDKTESGRQEASSVPTSDKPAKPKDGGLGLGKAVIVNAVNQASQYALSNYGNLTGDYITQANIQGGLEIIGLGVMALSGPVGAVGAIGALAIKAASRQAELIKKNQQTQLLRARTGMMNYSGGRL